MKKKIMFEISPELNDGDHPGVCRTVKQLVDAVQAWAECALDNKEGFCEITVIQMTDKAYEAIPEV